MRTSFAIAGLALGALLLTACFDNVTDVAARNLCSTPVQVEMAERPDAVGRSRLDVPVGETLYLGSVGDRTSVNIRVGLPLADAEARLDGSIPLHVYRWDELLLASPDEEDAGGYEAYVVIEGALCP